MSPRKLAFGTTFNQPHWDGHGTSPIGWEGHDAYDLDFLSPDDPDLVAAAMDAAHETDTRTRERIVESISDIPAPVLKALTSYVNLGSPPDLFLTAVLENDLAGAVAFADDGSLAALTALVVLIHNETPGECWRSPDRVAAWLRMWENDRLEIVANCHNWQRFMEVTDAVPVS